MDQKDEKRDQRPTPPQQDQIQRPTRPPPQQSWPQRSPNYQLSQQQPQQQPQYPVPASQRQYGQQQPQEMGNPMVASGALMGGQDVEYHAQTARGGGPSQVTYPAAMHQSGGTAYGGYQPQHYGQAPPPQQLSQQIYHQQQLAMSQAAIQQQQLRAQQQQQQPQQRMVPGLNPQQQIASQRVQTQPYVQPTAGRLPADRPIMKLSVHLIDTYKQINKVYYEGREARRAARAAQKAAASAASRDTGGKGQGVNNNGWDDENYDYIVKSGEMFYGRYIIKERIGKGSFGQVVRGHDTETNKDVAIKIIKSKKPFLIQAKTEIELLSQLCEKDAEDENNIVRLLTHFIYRNHQCLVFEMLSLNLYELLKNTQFGGVSLNLIRKFAKQILKSLAFLARPDVDIIHCDLKPENILLRHPKRSGVKVIDFGSSCRSNKRMYSYIQSRFYRSPEVMLGLPYSVAIDTWSLGCILSEMHTGEPLFSGSDQFDQMQKIVKLLGMVPFHMLEEASDQHRLQFFERIRRLDGTEAWALRQTPSSTTSSKSSSKRSSSSQTKGTIVPSTDPIASLTEVIISDSDKRKKHPTSDSGASDRTNELFVDLIHRMLAYDPGQRIKPEEALNHPFIVSGEHHGQQSSSGFPTSVRRPVADEDPHPLSRARTQSESTQVMEDVESRESPSSRKGTGQRRGRSQQR